MYTRVHIIMHDAEKKKTKLKPFSFFLHLQVSTASKVGLERRNDSSSWAGRPNQEKPIHRVLSLSLD